MKTIFKRLLQLIANFIQIILIIIIYPSYLLFSITSTFINVIIVAPIYFIISGKDSVGYWFGKLSDIEDWINDFINYEIKW